MEPSTDNSGDRKAQIQDFNAITQNQDENVALHYLEMSAFDLNKAISLYMENPPHVTNNASISSSVSGNQSQAQNINSSILEQMAGIFPMFQNTNNNSNLTAQINEYKNYHREKEKKDAEFEFNFIPSMIRSSSGALKGIWNKIMPIAIRGETPGGEEFTYFLYRNYGKIKTFNFVHGNVLENVDYAHSKQRMLLIFIYSEQAVESLKNLQKTLLTFPDLIRYIDDNFVVLGLLQHKNETVSLVQKFPQIKDFPSFVIFRKNFYQNPVIVDIIPITEANSDPKSYLEKLKASRSTGSKSILEEEHIKSKALQELTLERQSRYFGYAGNPFFSFQDEFYDPSLSHTNGRQGRDLAAQRKLEMDRMLKKQQEEEYKQAQRLAEEQQLRKLKEEAEKKAQEQQRMKEEEEKTNLELKKQAEIQQKKTLLPSEPGPNEPDVFEVLFRLPNGSKISRRFRNDEEIEHLYTFVMTLDGSPVKNSFDVIRTMPSLNLTEKRGQKIKDVFEDSTQETFHIREID